MKFKSHLIRQLLDNQASHVENIIRAIQPDKQIVIAQGYGAHAKIPIRFLSYAIPTLRLAAQLPKTARIELYIAAKGSARANQAYYEQNLDTMALLLRNYVNEYHIQLASQVNVLGDAEIPSNAEALVNELMETAIVVAHEDSQLSDFIAKRSGERSLRYMVEHLLYMRDPIKTETSVDELLIVPGMSVEYEHLIMVGGPSEKIFWRLRQELLKRYGSHTKWQSHQFFTPIGDPPPYHWYPGEPVLGDTLPENVDALFSQLLCLPGDKGKQKNIVRDYSLLLQDLAGVEIFQPTSKVSVLVLEKGYQALKRFLVTYL